MDDTFSKSQLGFGILHLYCENISLLLCVEVMYIDFFAPYTDHNLHQFALLQKVSRDYFLSEIRNIMSTYVCIFEWRMLIKNVIVK